MNQHIHQFLSQIKKNSGALIFATISACIPLTLASISIPAISTAAAQNTASISTSTFDSYAMLKEPQIRHLKKALKDADSNRWDRAFSNAKKANEPEMEKLLNWLYFQNPRSKASFSEITDFIEKNSHWPHQRRLHFRAEEALDNDVPTEKILNWFNTHQPYTVKGIIFYAKALQDAGRQEKAKALITKAWRERNMTAADETIIKRRYKSWLRKADHEARLESLLWSGATNAAKRQAKRVSKDLRLLAEARITLRRQAAGVDWAIKRVPTHLKNHPGLIYERLRWRLRKGRYEDALPLLNNPLQEMEQANLWWAERRRLVRWALRDNRIEEAYIVASNHSTTSGYPYAEAEWLSGWIALRFLNDAESALTHFTNMSGKVRFPISVSRAHYWIGRSHEAMGQTAKAKAAYAEAARFPHRFYGQLAAGYIGEFNSPFKQVASQNSGAEFSPIPAPASDSFPDLPENSANRLLPVVLWLNQLGEEKLVKQFIFSMVSSANQESEYKQLAALGHHINRLDLAIHTARKADQQQILLPKLGYPIFPIHDEDFLDPPIIQSIIRQESGFYTKAQSSAGALGLMQLMPATAKRVARDNKLSYKKSRLTLDPHYNVTLGQSYLGGLIERFDGSLPMAFAGYNAGPSRVDRWKKENGDPRVSMENLIDWIESIPFSETRNYVQRVSENLVIYRQKLNSTEKTVGLNFETLLHVQNSFKTN